jgi:hypothetical protein
LSVIVTLVVTLAIFILLVTLIVTRVVKGGIMWIYDLTFSVTHTNKIKLPQFYILIRLFRSLCNNSW